ncbi:hypothetical protein DYB32_010795, partial [Aphanomyces invadans]
ATYVVFNADGSSGVIDRVTGAPPPEVDDSPRDDIDEDDKSKYLVVHVGDDRIVVDLAMINTPNNDGWTPLHASCHTLNAVDAGKAILKAVLAQDPSADLNIKTSRGPGSFSSGYTPLHIACAYGMEALVVKLIQAKADVHVTNSVQWTPLHEACHRGYTSIVKELLHAAAYHNRSDVVQMLVVYGADVRMKTNRGAMASELTISSEIKTMLEDMASHEVDAAVRNENGNNNAASHGGNSPGKASASKTSPSKERVDVKAPDGPLSRKEEFALLGDLPSLQRLHVPAKADQVHGCKTEGKAHKKKSKRKQSKDEAVPAEFQCAITHKLLVDPVKSPYGHVFERHVIEKWIQDYGHRCPITGEPLGHGQLTPDAHLKQEIAAWNAPVSISATTAGSPPKKQEEVKVVASSAVESKLDAKDPDEDDMYSF